MEGSACKCAAKSRGNCSSRPLERLKEAAATPVADGNSFEEIAREWLVARQLAWVLEYAAHIIRPLEWDEFPIIGDKDMCEITPCDLLDIFRAIRAHISLEIAYRIKNDGSEAFRYAIPDGRCDSEPTLLVLFGIVVAARCAGAAASQDRPINGSSFGCGSSATSSH
ncbi:phage integrase central domain-containing protein [Sphingopyxis sp. NJF-3]